MEEMKEVKIKMLCIDDEEHNLFGIKALFRKEFEVLMALNTEEAEKLLQTHNDISVIMCDQRMPGKTGTEFFSEIRVKYPDPMRILFTAFSDNTILIDAINNGWIYKYVQKPLEIDGLNIIIQQAHEVYALKKENEMLTRKIVAYNEELKKLLTKSLEDIENLKNVK